MSWTQLPPFLVAAVVAIVSWFVVNALNAKRERAAQRRARRVEFLLDAYRRLERAAEPREPREHWADLETAIADIQLLGNVDQVRQAEVVARVLAQEGTAVIRDLLRMLRDDLRRELDLGALERNPVFLRFRDRAADDQTQGPGPSSASSARPQ